MDTDVQDGPPTQDAAIERAYAKYMAALATHTQRPAAPFSGDSRDYLLVPTAPPVPATGTPVK